MGGGGRWAGWAQDPLSFSHCQGRVKEEFPLPLALLFPGTIAAAISKALALERLLTCAVQQAAASRVRLQSPGLEAGSNMEELKVLTSFNFN